MDKKEVDELIVKAAHWGARAAESIGNVGGSPVAVLKMFSDVSIEVMVRNGLEIKERK